MDPHLIDLVWEVQREANAKEPIEVVCGYRAPQTNAMLRRRSGGVARFSQHMLGHALDFYIPGIALEQLREVGLRLQRGGVGFYPTSGSPFVHMDTAGVRMWPRMTHEELARVFPDGRTVHIPSDGKPLPGYALALADIRKHGGTPSEISLDAARSVGVNVETVLASNERPAVNPFAKLLGLAREADDEDDAAARSAAAAVSAPLRAQPKPAMPASIATAQRNVDNKPAAGSMADARPSKPASDASTPKVVQVAALLPPSSSAAPAQAAEVASAATANDIIRTRGYWQGPPDGVTTTTPSARPSRREASPKSGGKGSEATGAIGPFPDPRAAHAAAEVTLAYAEQPPAHPPEKPSIAGVAALRAAAISPEPEVRPARALYSEQDAPAAPAIPSGTTIAVKRVANQVASAILSAGASSVIAIKAGMRLENPWLRAVLVAPSVQRFLTTLALGARDFRSLAALMVKPRSSVMMTFAADPYPGLNHERFSGPAVVFVSTVSYQTRTAVLQ
jgi:hypothetical protein